MAGNCLETASWETTKQGDMHLIAGAHKAGANPAEFVQWYRKTLKIRELNDLARKQTMVPIFGDAVPCKTIYTQGIHSLGPCAVVEIAALVRDFDDYTEDNDAHGEHDFGAFDYEGRKVFRKIGLLRPGRIFRA